MSWALDGKNALWMLADKLSRFVGGVVIGIVMARYLGPEKYGQLNFAQAWVGMFAGIAWLGVGDAVVRDLVQRPGDGALILATSLRLRLLGSMFTAALAIGIYIALGHGNGNGEGISMVLLLSASILLLEPVSVTMLWFQARRNLKPVGIAKTLGYTLHQGYRLLAVVGGFGVVTIAGGALLETAVTCGILLYVYTKSEAPKLSGAWSSKEAVRILRQGFPIMIAALLGTLFLRIDQVILGQLSGNHELGLYGAAIRLSEPWWAIPAILSQVLAPRLLYLPSITADEKREAITFMTTFLFYSALCVAALVTMFAEIVVPLLLGQQYIGTVPILVIHVWIAIFVFVDAAAYQYLVSQNFQRFILWKTGLALACNVLLSLALAPKYGAVGVAYGTLVAYVISAVVAYLLSEHTRPILVCQLRGIILPHQSLRLLRTTLVQK